MSRAKLPPAVMAAHQAAKRKRVHADMMAMQREVTAAKKAAGILLGFGHPPTDDIMARLAEIPADTRSLTARTFGDPLPGRSALDRHPIMQGRAGR